MNFQTRIMWVLCAVGGSSCACQGSAPNAYDTAGQGWKCSRPWACPGSSAAGTAAATLLSATRRGMTVAAESLVARLVVLLKCPNLAGYQPFPPPHLPPGWRPTS